MTPLTTPDAAVDLDVFDRPVADDPTAPRAPMAQYPRMSEVLDRIRKTPLAAPAAPSQAAPMSAAHTTPAFPSAPTVAVPEAPVAHDVAAAAVAHAVSAPGVLVAHPNMPAPAPTPYDTLAVLDAPSRDALVVEPLRDDDDSQLTDEEIDELIAELGLRDTAREALRARLVAFGQNRHQRTAYELVFLMLAFSVMVLITAPPLVQVLLALHGTAPS